MPKLPFARPPRDSKTAAARERGIAIARSQVRRILTKEGVRWRRTHTWATSEDPDFVSKGRGSSCLHRPASRCHDPLC